MKRGGAVAQRRDLGHTDRVLLPDSRLPDRTPAQSVSFPGGKRQESGLYGFEIELDRIRWNQLALEASFGCDRIEFTDHKDPVSRIDFTSNRAPFTTEYNLSLAVDYRHPGGLFARAEGVWIGRAYFDL